VSEYWNGASQLAVTIIVNSGVTVGGTTSDTTLLPQTGAGRNTTGNAMYFPPNVFKTLDTFNLINNGTIWGAGGKGGVGSTYGGLNGNPGKAAIYIPYYLNITNNGKIWAGMGGGGGGGGGWKEYAATNCYSINCNPYSCNCVTQQVLTNKSICCNWTNSSHPLDAKQLLNRSCLSTDPNYGTGGYIVGGTLPNTAYATRPCGGGTYYYYPDNMPSCNVKYGPGAADCTSNGSSKSVTVDTCNYSGKKTGKKGNESCSPGKTLTANVYYVIGGKYLQQYVPTQVCQTCYQSCPQNCYRADIQIGADGGKGYGYDCRPNVATGGIFTRYVQAYTVSPNGYGGSGGYGANFNTTYGATGNTGTSTTHNIYPGFGTSPGTPSVGFLGGSGGRAGCSIDGINNCTFTTVGELVGYDTISTTSTTITVKKTSTNTNLQTFGSYYNNVINSAYNFNLKVDRATPLGIYDNTTFNDVLITPYCGYAISNTNTIYYWDQTKNTTVTLPNGVVPVKFASENGGGSALSNRERPVVVIGNDNKLYIVNSTSAVLMNSNTHIFFETYYSVANTRIDVVNVQDAVVTGYYNTGGSHVFDVLVLGTDNKLYYGGRIDKAGMAYTGTSYTSVYYSLVDSVRDKTFKSIAMGSDYVLALTTDNIVYSWGKNLPITTAAPGNGCVGKLGIGDPCADQETPAIVQYASGQRPVEDLGLTPYRVYTGPFNSYILCTDGSLYAAGINRNGLNLNNTNNNGVYSVFTRVVVPSTGAKIVDVYPQSRNVYYLQQTSGNINTLYGVGNNDNKQLGINYPTNVVYTSPISVTTENWKKISVTEGRTDLAATTTTIAGLTQINRTLTDSTAPNLVYYTNVSSTYCSVTLAYNIAGYFFQPTPTRTSTPVPTPTRTATPTPTPTLKPLDTQYLAAYALSKDQKSLLYSLPISNTDAIFDLSRTTGNVYTLALGIYQNNYHEQMMVVDVTGPNYTVYNSTDRFPILKIYQEVGSSTLTLTNIANFNQPLNTNTYPPTVQKDIILVSPPNRESTNAQRYIDSTVPKYSFIWESNGGGMFIDNNNNIIASYPSYTFVYNTFLSQPGHATYCVSPDGEYAFIYAGPQGTFAIDVISLRQSDYGFKMRIPLAPQTSESINTVSTQFSLRITMACTSIDIDYNRPGYILWLSCDKNGNPGYIRIDKNAIKNNTNNYTRLTNSLIDGYYTPLNGVMHFNYVKPFVNSLGIRSEIPYDVFFTKGESLTANYITSQITLLDDMRTIIWLGAPTTHNLDKHRGGCIIDTQTAYEYNGYSTVTVPGLYFRNMELLAAYFAGSSTTILYAPDDTALPAANSELMYCTAGALAGSVQRVPQLWGVYIKNTKTVVYPFKPDWYISSSINGSLPGGFGYTKIGIGYTTGITIPAPKYNPPQLDTTTPALTCNDNIFMPIGKFSFGFRSMAGFGIPGPIQLGYIRNATQQSPYPN
jgi:hypothetical protein